jgi:signal transduction histidine kinase
MFQDARLKLAGWYLAIILLISISFSVVLYKVLTLEIDRFTQIQRFRVERQYVNHYFGSFSIDQIVPVPPAIDPDLISDIKHRILVFLFFINGGIAVISALLGYFLAGRTLKPIQIMVEDQNRFISDASHELRTPLTSLRSNLEVNLRDKNLSLDRAKILITESIEEVDHLNSLSEGLLALTGQPQLAPASGFALVDIGKIINQSLAQISPLAKNKNITLTYLPKVTKARVNSPAVMQLITILLDNAIKYSPPDTQIVVDNKIKADCIKITIKDQGIGISSNDLPHLFDRFYRADLARSKATTPGFGLGLAIAKKIIDLHHGSIMVKSQIDHGSTFIINLPRKNNN